MRKPVCLSLSEETLVWVDGVRGDVPRSRFVDGLLARERDGSRVPVVATVPVVDVRSDPSAESVADAVRTAPVGRPVKGEGESVVAFKIRQREWLLANE